MGGIFLEYLIGEFAKITGFSIHTLRYYEKEHLIMPARNSSNRRCYSDKDIEWAGFIKRLKETGMPVKEIKQYAALRAAGDNTLKQRMEMLIMHRKSLGIKIKQMEEHMDKLDSKIKLYKEKIKNIEK